MTLLSATMPESGCVPAAVFVCGGFIPYIFISDWSVSRGGAMQVTCLIPVGGLGTVQHFLDGGVAHT